jgi:hypothetical protein
MTVSGPSTSINLAFSALAAVFVCAGCIPALAPAPFPAASDTTEPGTLVGPFSGRVSDGQSGRPIPGALVWVSWRFCKGASVCQPAGTATASTETDADGRYLVPRLARLPGPVRLDGVTLIVYKRGYTGYRSDRIFDEQAPGGATPRGDFAQLRNLVRMEVFPEAGSHAAHVLFLGGSGALRAALRPEALQAGIDAAHASGPASAAPLDATTLLSVEELRQVTGAVDEIEVVRLEDRPRTARYDSAHFKASSGGEESDAALRVFLGDSTAEVERTYEELYAELPAAEGIEPAPPGLGVRAARGRDGDGNRGILGLLVLDRAQRATVILTCGVARCRNHEMLETLARKVVARLGRVAHPPPQPPGRAPAASPPPRAPEPEPADGGGMKLREPGLHR